MSEAEYFDPWFAAVAPLFAGGTTEIVRAGGAVHGVVRPSAVQMEAGRRHAALTVTNMAHDPTSEIARALADIRATDARWL